MPPENAHDKTMDGHAKGAVMSVNDLVAYLIGWNALVLKWLERDDRGEAVDFPETGCQWNELGALAGKFYEEHGSNGFDENRRTLWAVKDQLVQNISARSDGELYGAPWHRQWTKGRMIQLNSSSPYENARARIRKWLKSQGV